MKEEYRSVLVLSQEEFKAFATGQPIQRTRDEIIDDYIKTLANLVGSEEEARMMVYSVSVLSEDDYIFWTLLSKELSHRVEVLIGVKMILPDMTKTLRHERALLLARGEVSDLETQQTRDTLEKLA